MNFLRKSILNGPGFLFFTLASISLNLSSCSGNLDPLNRYIPTVGKDYCAELNEVIDYALVNHLIWKPKDKAKLYRQALQASAIQVIGDFSSKLKADDQNSFISKIKFKNEDEDLKALESCSHIAELSGLIMRIAKLADPAYSESQQNQLQNRLGFFIFLSHFAQQLDAFSSYQLPSPDANIQQAYSFGLLVPTQLSTYYSYTPKRTIVLKSNIDSIHEGDQLISLKSSSGIRTSSGEVVAYNQDIYLNSLPPESYKAIVESFLNNRSNLQFLNFQILRRDTSNDPQNVERLRVPVSSSIFVSNPLIDSRILAEDALYIRIPQFYGDVSSDFLKEFIKLETNYLMEFYKDASYPKSAERPTLILDLRWNPGGRVADFYKIATLFFEDSYLGTEIDGRGIEHPIFTKDIRQSLVEASSPLAGHPSYLKDYPVIILMNHASASAAEMLAETLGSARKNGARAFVIGEESFGKGIYQFGLELQQLGGVFHFTGSRFYAPDGNNYQINRFSPQFEVLDPFIEERKDQCEIPKAQCPALTMKEHSGILIPATPTTLSVEDSSNFEATEFTAEELVTANERLAEIKAASGSSDEDFDDQLEFAKILANELSLRENPTPRPQNDPINPTP